MLCYIFNFSIYIDKMEGRCYTKDIQPQLKYPQKGSSLYVSGKKEKR